jgi:hypothetical protein
LRRAKAFSLQCLPSLTGPSLIFTDGDRKSRISENRQTLALPFSPVVPERYEGAKARGKNENPFSFLLFFYRVDSGFRRSDVGRSITQKPRLTSVFPAKPAPEFFASFVRRRQGRASDAACRATAAPITLRWYQERSALETFVYFRARRSARAAFTSAAISSSEIGGTPAASSAGAIVSKRPNAKLLDLSARNSTKSSTTAICWGESILSFEIKPCSIVAPIVESPAFTRIV